MTAPTYIMSNKTNVATYLADICGGLRNICVYCNVIQPRFVDKVIANLLRLFKFVVTPQVAEKKSLQILTSVHY